MECIFRVNWQNYMGWDYSRVTVAYSIMLMCVGFNGTGRGMLLQRFRSQKADDRSRYYVGTWLVCNRNGRKYYYAVCKLRYPLQAIVPPDLAIIQVS